MEILPLIKLLDVNVLVKVQICLQLKMQLKFSSKQKYCLLQDFAIYFVDYKSQADLKVFFVEYKSQAGWQTKEKKHLLY